MSHKAPKAKPNRFSDVDRLNQRIALETPKPGEYFYDYKLAEAQKEEQLLEEQEFHAKFKINFSDLPISSQTLKGLTGRGFTKMTEVQRCTIPHALGGRDLMTASRTGSGKTLAYLIPLVEKLYRQRFIPLDGLGAIVLVPVRELAMQVFEVLNSFTSDSELSVGLVIGGKDVTYEQERIKLINILVCTPGRLLQHLEETYGFETTHLQMLVLDQADVMLEMGFKETLTAILSNLPKCQTLFYSATLNHQIHSLASICMTDPERVFLHSARNSEDGNQLANIYETPARLTQYYLVVSPQDKLNILYSFLKSHLKQKILVFVSTCKQVRFIYESFKKFRMGFPMYELQGHQKQKKRMAIYFTFTEKRYGMLVCTNIASRGLDFPKIDWVIQFDLPDNIETYVHRVGRTARFKAQGRALAFIAPQEEAFVQELQAKSINIHKITQNPQKYLRIEGSLQSICSEHQDVKYLAQRALVSYLKFIHKAQNKKIFSLKGLDLEALANSYGLPSAPVINLKIRQEEEEDGVSMTKIDKLRLKAKMKKAQIKESKLKATGGQLLTIKAVVKSEPDQKPVLSTSKRQLKRIKEDGHFEGRNRIFFDENLNKITSEQRRLEGYLANNREEVDYDPVQEMNQRLETHHSADQTQEKERRKLKRKKLAARKDEQAQGGTVAVLGDQSD